MCAGPLLGPRAPSLQSHEDLARSGWQRGGPSALGSDPLLVNASVQVQVRPVWKLEPSCLTLLIVIASPVHENNDFYLKKTHRNWYGIYLDDFPEVGGVFQGFNTVMHGRG